MLGGRLQCPLDGAMLSHASRTHCLVSLVCIHISKSGMSALIEEIGTAHIRSAYESELERLWQACRRLGVSTKDVISMLLGIKYARRTGLTPREPVLKLLDLFCKTGGEFQELIHRIRYDSIQDQFENLVLEDTVCSFSAKEFTSVIHELVDNGYAILQCKIKKRLCSDLFTSLDSLTLDLRDGPACSPKTIVKNGRSSSQMTKMATTAHCRQHDLESLPQYNLITSSKAIQSIVSFYLGCPAILVQAPLWLSFPAHDGLSKDHSAQQFHFDMDEIRWLKVFVYLNSVSTENGPHQYIPGTHKPKNKHEHLLARGYSRIPEEKMMMFHPCSSWTSITGGPGTIVFADTRCWHRGLPLVQGCRGAIVMQYAPSAFGRTLI